MLDHVSLETADLERAMAFYDAVLAALGAVRSWTKDDAAGYGHPGRDEELALNQRAFVRIPGAGFHLAFAARSRAEVDAFHRAALEQGGVDHGAPGLRPEYGPGYYAAYVGDPDGHRLEAVHHEPVT